MGFVFNVYAVYPEGPDEAKGVEESVRALKVEGAELRDLKVEPLAFGLSVVKVGYVFDDKGSKGLDVKIEEELKKVKGVQSVEVAMSTLL